MVSTCTPTPISGLVFARANGASPTEPSSPRRSRCRFLLRRTPLKRNHENWRRRYCSSSMAFGRRTVLSGTMPAPTPSCLMAREATRGCSWLIKTSPAAAANWPGTLPAELSVCYATTSFTAPSTASPRNNSAVARAKANCTNSSSLASSVSGHDQSARLWPTRRIPVRRWLIAPGLISTRTAPTATIREGAAPRCSTCTTTCRSSERS